jgi:hypothetical protein
MQEASCCANFTWVFELDLGEAEHFDFALGRCGNCGRTWLSVFCPASQVICHEPVSSSDVERMRALPPGPEVKAFMRKWARENI